METLKQVHSALLIYVLLMIGVLGSRQAVYGVLLIPVLCLASGLIMFGEIVKLCETM